jgi:hypothetical protein
MNPAGSSIVFSSGNAGATFLVLLALGIAVATALFTLLPWPPGVGGTVMCAIVWVVCGAVALSTGHHRQVEVDFGARQVTERTKFLGVEREHSWRLDEFETVVIEEKRMKVRRSTAHQGQSRVSDYDTVIYFVLSAVGPQARLRLETFRDPAAAERAAGELSERSGWKRG